MRAQLRVEVRERLIHEEHSRLADDGSREGDTLLLAAGELGGPPREEVADAQELRDPLHFPRLLRGTEPTDPQRILDVVAHRHVRVERVALKDEGDVAILGFEPNDTPPVDQDVALIRILEPREHAQRSRLSASRRTEQHQELAIGDVEIEMIDRRPVLGREALRNVVVLDARHLKGLASSRRGHAPSSGGWPGRWPSPGPRRALPSRRRDRTAPRCNRPACVTSRKRRAARSSGPANR